MAVRNDFTAGEVLAAADLNDTFASKPTFTYGTATPTADADGAIWYDENDTPPTPKFWDGSAWQAFSSGIGAAAISSPAATGQYTDSGITYDYYVFNSSGTLTVDDNGSGFGGFADVLLVGGGGGGGQGFAGGGGGGGHLEIVNAYLPAGSLTITVGAGGAGGVRFATEFHTGNNGIASRCGSYFAPGGGGGAGATRISSSTEGRSVFGLNGGSGGGAAGFNAQGGSANGGAGISGLGNSGGASASLAGGGGGGAGAAGSNGTSAAGGAGGNGAANSYTGSSVTRAGGGGGGGNSTSASGGSGGGGAGATSGTATAGTANTGGGGGGVGQGGAAGGAGGSGVVIVRVKV